MALIPILNTKAWFQRYFIVICLCSGLLFSGSSYADTIVIASKNFPIDTITIQKLKKLWLGKTKKIKSVGRVYVIDQLENDKITKAFYQAVINKNPKQVQAYWAKIKFIGKGYPPKTMLDDMAVIKWVSEQDNRIGYIKTESKTNEIKILLNIVEPK